VRRKLEGETADWKKAWCSRRKGMVNVMAVQYKKARSNKTYSAWKSRYVFGVEKKGREGGNE
jgi:hypothetical protein